MKPIKHIDLIHQLCQRTRGCSLREASDAIQRTFNIAGKSIYSLMARGKAFKAGLHGEYRYFSSKEAADAHNAQIELERENRIAAANDRRKMLEAQRARERRAKAREEKGLPPYEPPKPKQPKPAKRVSTEKKPSVLVLGKNDAKKQHLKANIIWPEHVKVQKAPTPKDERFTFTPPDKNWRGVISQDWEQRKAA